MGREDPIEFYINLLIILVIKIFIKFIFSWEDY